MKIILKLLIRITRELLEKGQARDRGDIHVALIAHKGIVKNVIK